MVRLAVDAMGGDYAPQEIVRGVVAALQAKADLKVFLVGHREKVEKSLAGTRWPVERLELVHAAEIIHGDDNPGMAFRRKKDSSMVKALQLVQKGEADAVLSAGNTGAFMAGALLLLGPLPKVSRPALLAVMHGFRGKPFVILDVGANMDARPGQLVQYAFMGCIYARELLGCASPRVALLNVGAEQNKGNSQVKKAFPLLQEYVSGFSGNIEGTDLFFDAADVVVCDGFVGNILLKLSEGLARGMAKRSSEMAATQCNSSGDFHLHCPGIAPGGGGAPLVGVKGLCIKCHGSAKAGSIEQAVLGQVYPFVKLRLEELFQKALSQVPIQVKEDGRLEG